MKVSLTADIELPIIIISSAYANICTDFLNIVPFVFIQEAETNNVTEREISLLQALKAPRVERSRLPH
jgi:hypothetical protein